MEKQKTIYDKWNETPVKKYTDKEKEEVLKKIKQSK